MSDSLNLFARAVCYQGQEGGGALQERFADWLRPAQDQQEDGEAVAQQTINKFLKDLGGQR